MMKWLLFYQTPIGDFIKMISSENRDPKYVDIKKFYKIIEEYTIENMKDLKISIEYFDTIYLDLETGIWERKVIEHNEDFSFEDLYKLNQPKKKEKKSFIDKSKEFIENLSRKNDNIK
jgi:hypothetical protein